MTQTTKLKINESKPFGRDEPISVIPMDTQNHQYVVDEDSLLDHIIRQKNKILSEITEHYTDFVCAQIGKPL